MDTIRSNTAWEREIKKQQEKFRKQEEQLNEIKRAEEKYELDGNIDDLLQFWRGIWKGKKGLLFNGNKWTFRYPELLIKEKHYDEAWGFLNRLSLEKPEHLSRIRNMQYKILKAEGKHYPDAIFYLMSSILLDLKDTYDPVRFFKQREEGFIKKAVPLLKKIGCGRDEAEYLAGMLETEIKRKCFDEGILRSKYEKFLSEKKI